MTPASKAGRLEKGGGECVNEFLKRDAVLEAERHGDREIVHQRPEGRALLVHIDENLADAPIRIISSSKVDLLTADAGLLIVAEASVRKAFALWKPGGRGGRRPLPFPFLIFAGVMVLSELQCGEAARSDILVHGHVSLRA